MLGYNRMTGYNKARYNAEGTELSASDSVTATDDTITRSITKSLLELMTALDNVAKQQNKSVTEIMNVDAWLSVDRKDSDQWSD